MSLSKLFHQLSTGYTENMTINSTQNTFYKMNYDILLELPIIKKLIKANELLKKENKALKNLIYSLPEFRSNKTTTQKPRRKLKRTALESTHNEEVEPEVVFVEKIEIKKEPNIIYCIEDDDEENAIVNVTAQTSTDIKEELEVEEEAEEEEAEEEEAEEEEAEEEEAEEEEAEEEEAEEEEAEEEEAEEEEAEEEEAEEEEAEEEEAEEEEAEEEEAEEEEAEEEEAEEEEAEEEEANEATEEDEEGVFEVIIKGKSYYTNNETSGEIYNNIDGEPSNDSIGIFKNGIPSFHTKVKK